MAESVERGLPVRKVGSLIPDQVKPMTYKIGICRFLTSRSAILAEGKNWLSQCPDNVTEWDIRSGSGLPVGQQYKVTLSMQSLVGTWPDMTLNVATR